MQLRALFLGAALMVTGAMADEKSPADPIPDKLRAEIAVAQRDYLLLQQQAAAVLANLNKKLEEAKKACASAEFNPQTLTCGTEKGK